MRTLLYPGSFDPVTVGHLDIITRAAKQCDRLIVGVLHNPQKPSGLFTVAQRLAFLRESCKHIPHSAIEAFDGLLVDVVQRSGANAVLRGLRSEADFVTEAEMARLNQQMKGVETIFLVASPEFVHISAKWVREIYRLGGDIKGMVPEAVRAFICRGIIQE